MRCAAIFAAFLWLASPSAAETYTFPAAITPASELHIEGSGDIEAIEPLIRDYQSLNPQVSITYTDTLTNDLYEKLQKVCGSGSEAPDLVFSSSVDHMLKLANDGCASPHVSPETARAPDHAKWLDQVFGFTFEPAVIVYNRKLVASAEVPRTRDELADLLRAKPQVYDRRVGTYDIARSGIGYLFAFFDAQQSSTFGRLTEAFGRSHAKLYCCTGELLAEIEAGRVLIGYNLLGSYAYGRYRAGAPIGIVMPSDYTLILSRAAFVPDRAKNPAAGRAFLDYLLSFRGQQVVKEKSFYFAQGAALPPGIDAPEEAIQAGITRPIPIGPALLAAADRHKRQRLLTEWAQSLGAE